MTESPKIPFYIIGWNPNTLDEVADFLKAGANAIEPDVHEDNGVFYVSPDPVSDPRRRLLMKDFLGDLSDLIQRKKHNLCWIAFDLKRTYDYDLNDLYESSVNTFSRLIQTLLCQLRTIPQ